jgi:predicted GTPase
MEGESVMSRWRLLLIAILVLAPIAALVVIGSVYLWRENLWRYVWWPLVVCAALGYLLAWHWQRQRKLLPVPEMTPPSHWTERDRQAWKLVESRVEAALNLSPDKFTDFNFYVVTAEEMALELARSYHPGVQDPIGQLTIPEMLAVVELAAHDLAGLVDRYVPGGHLLTINNFRQARQAADWYEKTKNVGWLVAAVFSPVDTAVRFLASQAGLSRPWQMLQRNLLVWFYTAYVHRLGTYLIDLHSGRLRVGARRYQELLQGTENDGVHQKEQAESDSADQARLVTVTVLGQVKAGKSSLANALLGEQRALADVLPATNEVNRYELQPQGVPTRLVLLDTVGYGHEGPKADQLRITEETAQRSDLLLLVLHARNPARQADAVLLKALRDWFAARPDLRMPPILGVVTHIDLLSPALEWLPPYDWREPRRPKEQQIAGALEAVREQLGEYLAGILPVCTEQGKVYGVEESLLPAVTELLDEAHAVGLLRCIRAEIDTEKVRRVFRQLKDLAFSGALVLWQNLPAKRDGHSPP